MLDKDGNGFIVKHIKKRLLLSATLLKIGLIHDSCLRIIVICFRGLVPLKNYMSDMSEISDRWVIVKVCRSITWIRMQEKG